MARATNNLAAPCYALPVLTFAVADQSCCFPVEQVVRIIEMVTITRLPAAPDSIQGVINLHGRPVPVIDLRGRLGLPRQAYGLSTPIILVEINNAGQLVGIVVDVVEDVLRIVREDKAAHGATMFDELASEGDQPVAWLKGIGTVEGRMMLILDARALLSHQEQQQLHQISDRNVQFSL